MKISIISDPHINKSLYKGVMDKKYSDLPFRTVDFMNAFEFAIDQSIKISPDLIVITGDTYDTYDPSNAARTFLNIQLKKLSDANIPTVLITGNHDICRKHFPLEPVNALQIKNIKILESPHMSIFKDKILLFFPFSMQVEKGEINILDQFRNFVKDCQEKIKNGDKFKGKEILFFGHFPVKGGGMNKYTKTEESDNQEIKFKKVLRNTNTKDISVLDLETIGASYVFLGDYHRHQILPTRNCRAMYAGSLEKTDMNEIDEKKGFILYDSEAKEDGELGKCKFIEYLKCRPMLQLSGNLEEIEKQLDSISVMEGAIVKIAFNGNNEDLNKFSMGLESFKKKLKQKIDPIHIFHTQNVENKEEEQVASKIESDILARGHLQSNDVMDVVKEMIREKTKDQKEILTLDKMALDIYKETMEK